MSDKTSRRQFLISSGATLLGGWLGSFWETRLRSARGERAAVWSANPAFVIDECAGAVDDIGITGNPIEPYFVHFKEWNWPETFVLEDKNE